MTISPNRIRYLDKENKVLVQDFSDIEANVPMSNVDTPMTIEAMDAIDEGFRLLQSLERDLVSIVNALTDENIGRYLVDTLLNNFRLNLPGFPGINAFVGSLRGMSPNIFGGFINALIAEAANTLFDTPSLINRKTGNTQQQIVNIALNNFARQLASGKIDQGYINRLSNYGTSDPYAVNAAVTRLNNDYKYATNEQDKFKLPKDTRVADTLICYMSLSLAYHNYLYSKLKLDDKVVTSVGFFTSLETGTILHADITDRYKAELMRTTIDPDSMVYYAEQLFREIASEGLSRMKLFDYGTQLPLLNKYLSSIQSLMNASMAMMKQKLANTVYDAYQNPITPVFIGNIFGRIKAGTLVLNETIDPVDYDRTVLSLTSEFQNHLRSCLFGYLKSGKPSKDLSNMYVLINARNSFYKAAIEQRNHLTQLQWKTLFSLLEVFYSIDLYTIEGDLPLTAYQIRLTSPISTYVKITTEKFYTVCFEFLKLLNRQFYVSYPKEGSTGLIANLVDKMNQVRMNLVLNHFSIRDVLANISATYADLIPVLEGSLLQEAFSPTYFNSYDADIYTLYKRNIGKFVFGSEDVTVVP